MYYRTYGYSIIEAGAFLVEDAVQSGLRKVAETVKNIQGAWVNEIKVKTKDDGTIEEWRVNLRVTFVVE